MNRTSCPAHTASGRGGRLTRRCALCRTCCGPSVFIGALLDALTIRRRKGRLGGLTVAICGDIVHSRVARSNIALLNTMGARVRVVAPRTLLPAEIEKLGVEVFHDMARGLADVDIVMILRLQSERMHGAFIPSTREYFHFFGLDYDKLRVAKP